MGQNHPTAARIYETYKVNLEGKIALVTGGSRGIGFEVSRILVRAGAHVILTSRSQSRADSAVHKIAAAESSDRVEGWVLENSDFDSVRNLARRFLERKIGLDFLVLNAGAINQIFERNREGVEYTFAVNHLGPFLLYNLLLPALQSARPSRIIVTSSVAHWLGEPNFKYDYRSSPELFIPGKAYVQSKLAALMCASTLHQQLEEKAELNRWGNEKIVVHTLHPGSVNSDFEGMNFAPLWDVRKYGPGTLDSSEGAATTLYCCLSPDLTEGGGYYSNAALAPRSARSKQLAAAQRLWDDSLGLVKLDAAGASLVPLPAFQAKTDPLVLPQPKPYQFFLDQVTGLDYPNADRIYERYQVNLTGKMAIVTGGSHGLGFEIARILVKAGAHVILTSRSQARANSACERIAAMEKQPSDRVEGWVLENSDFNSVRSFARRFLEKKVGLDLLMLNAGCINETLERNSEGFEYQFAANHLGPFLTYHLLLPALARARPSRIVLTSSIAHWFGNTDFRNDYYSSAEIFDSGRAYVQSKLAVLMCGTVFHQHLEAEARRSGWNDKKVIIHIVHPGFVGSDFGVRHFGKVLWEAYKHAPGTLNPSQGAATSLYCALNPELVHGGGYYANVALAPRLERSKDMTAARKVFDDSLGFVKLDSSGSSLVSLPPYQPAAEEKPLAPRKNSTNPLQPLIDALTYPDADRIYETYPVDLSGKVALVTGGSHGLGYHIVRILVRAGAAVILTSRNQERADLAVRNILEREKKPSDRLEGWELENSDFNSVRRLCRRFLDRQIGLDLLVLNAGCINEKLERNPDGVEYQFAANHLGPFLTYNLLLPALKMARPSRIVVTSSIAHWFGKNDFKRDYYNAPDYFDGGRAYVQSKLAVLMAATVLHQRLDYEAKQEQWDKKNIAVHVINPGFVGSDFGARHFGKFLWTAYKYAPGVLNPSEGAATTLYCCLNPELTEGGGYYSGVALASRSSESKDRTAAQVLWDDSLRLVKLDSNGASLVPLPQPLASQLARPLTGVEGAQDSKHASRLQKTDGEVAAALAQCAQLVQTHSLDTHRGCERAALLLQQHDPQHPLITRMSTCIEQLQSIGKELESLSRKFDPVGLSSVQKFDHMLIGLPSADRKASRDDDSVKLSSRSSSADKNEPLAEIGFEGGFFSSFFEHIATLAFKMAPLICLVLAGFIMGMVFIGVRLQLDERVVLLGAAGGSALMGLISFISVEAMMLWRGVVYGRAQDTLLGLAVFLLHSALIVALRVAPYNTPLALAINVIGDALFALLVGWYLRRRLPHFLTSPDYAEGGYFSWGALLLSVLSSLWSGFALWPHYLATELNTPRIYAAASVVMLIAILAALGSGRAHLVNAALVACSATTLLWQCITTHPDSSPAVIFILLNLANSLIFNLPGLNTSTVNLGSLFVLTLNLIFQMIAYFGEWSFDLFGSVSMPKGLCILLYLCNWFYIPSFWHARSDVLPLFMSAGLAFLLRGPQIHVWPPALAVLCFTVLFHSNFTWRPMPEVMGQARDVSRALSFLLVPVLWVAWISLDAHRQEISDQERKNALSLLPLLILTSFLVEASSKRQPTLEAIRRSGRKALTFLRLAAADSGSTNSESAIVRCRFDYFVNSYCWTVLVTLLSPANFQSPEAVKFQTSAVLVHGVALALVTFFYHILSKVQFIRLWLVVERNDLIGWYYTAKAVDTVYVVYMICLAIIAVSPVPHTIYGVSVEGRVRLDVLIAVIATYFLSFLLNTFISCSTFMFYRNTQPNPEHASTIQAQALKKQTAWNILTLAEYFPVIYLYSLLVVGVVAVRLYLVVPAEGDTTPLVAGTLAAALGVLMSICQYYAVYQGYGLSHYSPLLPFTPSLEQTKTFVFIVIEVWVLFFSFFFAKVTEVWINRVFFILLLRRTRTLFKRADKNQSSANDPPMSNNDDIEMVSIDVSGKSSRAGKDFSRLDLSSSSSSSSSPSYDPPTAPQKLFQSKMNYFYSPVYVAWAALLYIMIAEVTLFWQYHQKWYVFAADIAIWWLFVIFVVYYYKSAQQSISLEVAYHLGLFCWAWSLTAVTKGVVPLVCAILWSVLQCRQWGRVCDALCLASPESLQSPATRSAGWTLLFVPPLLLQVSVVAIRYNVDEGVSLVNDSLQSAIGVGSLITSVAALLLYMCNGGLLLGSREEFRVAFAKYPLSEHPHHDEPVVQNSDLELYMKSYLLHSKLYPPYDRIIVLRIYLLCVAILMSWPAAQLTYGVWPLLMTFLLARKTLRARAYYSFLSTPMLVVVAIAFLLVRLELFDVATSTQNTNLVFQYVFGFMAACLFASEFQIPERNSFLEHALSIIDASSAASILLILLNGASATYFAIILPSVKVVTSIILGVICIISGLIFIGGLLYRTSEAPKKLATWKHQAHLVLFYHLVLGIGLISLVKTDLNTARASTFPWFAICAAYALFIYGYVRHIPLARLLAVVALVASVVGGSIIQKSTVTQALGLAVASSSLIIFLAIHLWCVGVCGRRSARSSPDERYDLVENGRKPYV